MQSLFLVSWLALLSFELILLIDNLTTWSCKCHVASRLECPCSAHCQVVVYAHSVTVSMASLPDEACVGIMTFVWRAYAHGIFVSGNVLYGQIWS